MTVYSPSSRYVGITTALFRNAGKVRPRKVRLCTCPCHRSLRATRPINRVAFSPGISTVRFTHDEVAIIQRLWGALSSLTLYLHNDAMHHHTLYWTSGGFHIFVVPSSFLEPRFLRIPASFPCRQ